MARGRRVLVLAGTALEAAAAGLLMLARHRRSGGRMVPGGIVMGDAVAYDTLTSLLMGPFYGAIATDVAHHAWTGAQVLEVGCGPGHLARRLASEGLAVTGLDLDPAMIERARANADRAPTREEIRPEFVVGDVAALPFPDASFDLVVSTLSMHHWADSTAGLGEIARALRPEGRALIWDLRPGAPLHGNLPDPVDSVNESRYAW